ncbi:MAG: hypothetical protein GY716_05295 [bacterium]|nr:hypothetical protein [bacterium]
MRFGKALAVMFVFLVTVATQVESRQTRPGRALRPQARPAPTRFGEVPRFFEANVGQSESAVRFVSRGSQYNVFLTKDATVVRLGRAGKQIRLRMAGNDSDAALSGVEPLEGKINYLLGNDPEKWVTDVPTYGRVRRTDVYPGIDVEYYGSGPSLEYDFVVRPGADPARISVFVDGAEDVTLEPGGDVRIVSGRETVVMTRPRVYQEFNGKRRKVDGRYRFRADGTFGFELGEFDRSRAVTIDPVLEYATYLGGSYHDSSGDIAVDAEGHAYVTGTSGSNNFPQLNPLPGDFGFSMFVTKFNLAGDGLIYSTLIGGNGIDNGESIAIDESGAAYLTGYTLSSTFPTTEPDLPPSGNNNQAFVTKLSPDGNAIVYSRLLGGTREDRGHGIAVDAEGRAHIAGWTTSLDLPTVSAVQTTLGGVGDALVAKLSVDGSQVLFLTYLGGTMTDGLDPGGGDYGSDVGVGPDGSVYVAGDTAADDFPVVNPFQSENRSGAFDADVFVSRLASNGATLIYSTYLGGLGDELPREMAVDANGNAYVIGDTTSPDFPVEAAVQPTIAGPRDAFVTKLSPAGNTLAYSTYLGGEFATYGQGIAVDAGGSAYVTGSTGATDFPILDAFQPQHAGFFDVFVSRFTPAGDRLIYSTFLGGTEGENVTTCSGGIALDSFGSAYIVGDTTSTDFPTVNPFQPEHGGGIGERDAFVAKIAQPQVTPTLTCLAPEVAAGPGCVADVPCSTIARCVAPGGDAVSLTCDPAGPYGLGSTSVAVECSYDSGTVEELCSVEVRDKIAPEVVCSLNAMSTSASFDPRTPEADAAGAPSPFELDRGAPPGPGTSALRAVEVDYSASDACGEVTVEAVLHLQSTGTDPGSCESFPVSNGELIGAECGTSCSVVSAPGEFPVTVSADSMTLVVAAVDAAGNAESTSCFFDPCTGSDEDEDSDGTAGEPDNEGQSASGLLSIDQTP